MSLDNVELDNLQAGDDVATDLISTDHYQMVKLTYGALGTANVVTSTATNPFPVALSDTDNAVLDTIDAVLDTINAKLVSGTVIGDVNLGATDNAVLDSMDSSLTTIAAAVGGTHTDDAAFTAGTSDGVPMFGFYDDTATDSVDEGDAGAVRMSADRHLYVQTRPHVAPGNHISERVSNTNGTSTAFTNFSAVASTSNYVTDITITNTSATDGYVDIRDGAAGAVLWTLPLPANSGATHNFSLPLEGTANTALAYDVSAALTTVYISVNGYQA